MSRLRVLLSVELDDAGLERYRSELELAGEVLYTEELGRTVRHWPGEPHEWTSLLDLRDLIDEGIIPRTEVLEVTKAPAPFGQEERGRLSRLLDTLRLRKGSP